MANWSSLPLLPLQLVLQQLPLKERMRDCSLVSTSWALAAAAATVDVSSCAFDLNSARRAKAAHLWCLKHQAHAKKLCYSNLRVMSSPLDHRHLRELCISTTWTVRLAASGQYKGLLQGVTALTRLKLALTSVYGWPDAVQQLTSLKSLTITNIKSKDPGDPHIPGKHLSLLPHLTYLELEEEAAVTAAALQQLSSLSRLQELRLAYAEWADESEGQEADLAAVNSGMGHLQRLTSLHLHCLSPVPVGTSKLSALEQLEVLACNVTQPQCFAGGASLKRLTISNSPVSGQVAQVQLLQHLGRMRHLTSLSLHGSLNTFGDSWEGVTPSALAGITSSSSSLQYLDLAECSLPEDAWHSIFRQSGQQLTSLTHLTLQRAAPELAANDIKKLVQACPRLLTLDLWDVLQPKVSLLALTKLTALTKLDISRVTTESGVRVLAHLTGLVELRVRQPSQVSRVSRLHLTALKRLHVLLLPACPSGVCGSSDDELEHYWMMSGSEEAFRNKGRGVPDVWAQLLVDCHKHMRLPAAQQAEARQAAHKFNLRAA